MKKAYGNSLGEAILNMISQEGGAGRRASYREKGWHAQLRRLQSTKRGQAILAKHGPKVRPATLKRWRDNPQTRIKKENEAAIRSAYSRAAGVFPQSLKQSAMAIGGEVQIGGDRRTRGTRGEAPLRINPVPHGWGRIEQAYNEGTLDEETAEEYLIEDVIEEDLGIQTEDFQFPGSDYRIDYT